ncbi:MAG: hypothetical protein LBR11_07895 [Deltaproteobacteria bacterium]|nr:hypothetical protein [Deltaproteobacteria bacterium]
MTWKIVSLTLAVTLVAGLVGCDIGDRRLPPNFRLGRAPDSEVYEDDYDPPRRDPTVRPVRRDPGSVVRPVRRDPDPGDQSGRRSGESSRDRRPRDERIMIFYGVTSLAELEKDPSLVITANQGPKKSSNPDIAMVASSNNRELTFFIVDQNRTQRTIKTRQLSFRIQGGRVVGLVY